MQDKVWDLSTKTKEKISFATHKCILQELLKKICFSKECAGKPFHTPLKILFYFKYLYVFVTGFTRPYKRRALHLKTLVTRIGTALQNKLDVQTCIAVHLLAFN